MTPEEIQQMNTTFDEFKKANEAMQAQIAKQGTASADAVTKFEKITASLDTLEKSINARMDVEEHKKANEALLARINDLEAKIARKGSLNVGEDDQAKAAAVFATKCFWKAMRWNGASGKALDELLGPEEIKALIIANDAQGGYLAPPEYVNEMLMNVVQYAAIRTLCRQRTTTRQSIQIPRRTTTAAATWTTETGTRPETTNPAFGMEELRTHELYAMVKVSRAELEDSAFDLPAFLTAEMSEQFALSEALAFITGNGVGKPQGFTTNASVTTVNNGSTTDLQADALISVYYDIKEPYLVNATWVMNRSTLKLVRQLKDGVGQYLWSPGIKSDARPATLLDRPYITAPEMAAATSGLLPIAFGDFKRGYMIVDRLVMEMMNDPYSSKANGMIEFSARRRVGGQVVIAEALRLLKMQ